VKVVLEAEESPLLKVLTGERLVKTQQTGKGLAGAVIICESWRWTIELQLPVFLSGVISVQ
jgi:hypothetical protein